MLKKIIRWLFTLLGIAALLLWLAIWWLGAYLNSNQEKILSEFVSTSGLDVSFRGVEIKAWQTFPNVNFTVDSLVVRDTARAYDEHPILAVEHFKGSFTLGHLWFDTLRLNSFELSHGAVNIVSDSLGRFNLGKLGEKKPPGDSIAGHPWLEPKLVWSGVTVALRNLDLAFLRPDRNKRIVLHLDSLLTTPQKTATGISVDSDLAAFVSGIAFNTDKGAFLADSPMRGRLRLDNNNGTWKLAPTDLHIRNETINVSGALGTGQNKGLYLHLECPATHYDSTIALLPEKLRNKLGKFDVINRFPVSADITTSLVHGDEPAINIGFELVGNDVRINQLDFQNVYTRGVFENELTVQEGGIPGSKKNFRISLDTTRADQESLHLRMPRAILRGVVDDTRLEAPIWVAGPASEINDLVKTENFFFRKGRFVLTTRLNESLNSIQDIIQSTDGQLLLYDTDVLYKPAGVNFPLRSLSLTKRKKDIFFQVQTGEVSSGFAFALDGEIDNILPLLLHRPAETMRTDVRLSAPRVRWEDFKAFFGEDGLFAEEKEAAPTQDAGEGNDQSSAMKKALLGLHASFTPHIEARFGELDYSDVLSLKNFKTGLHFDHDTLVLERTSFDWEGSTFDFGARIGLGEDHVTPFKFSTACDYVNLNQMRPSLEHFGLKLPGGMNTLPRELSIDFVHNGVINDSLGITPGYNSGRLIFREGSEGLFSGQLDYAPGEDNLETDLHLEGKPQYINQLFGAENFFFNDGRFRIDMKVDGTPHDLDELVKIATFALEIDSSVVEYRSAGVFVPIQKFIIRCDKEHLDYELQLLSDSTQRSVVLEGTLDRLSAFLYPGPGKTFKMKADISAESLHWDEVQDLFFMHDSTEAVNAGGLDLQFLLSATSGIFSTFRPELQLRIDTFWAVKDLRLINVRSGLRLQDSTQIILEPSGFRLGDGDVGFSAEYDIDQKLESPFKLNWKTDSLALGDILEALKAMDIELPEESGSISGLLHLDGDLVSKLDEQNQQILLDSTTGDLTIKLSDLELANWPALREIGRKAKMKKRFETLRFAPLELNAKLDNGKVWLPRTEVQSTALQFFVEGVFDTLTGPDLLIAVPLRNIGRGVLEVSPAKTGFAKAGWKAYLVMERDKNGDPKTSFRLGRRKFYRERGRLAELKELRKKERGERRN